MPIMSRSDIDEIKTQIQSTHAPDGREVDVNPLFHFVQHTLRQSIQYVDTKDHSQQIEPTTELNDDDDNNISDISFLSKLDALSDIIDRVSSKMATENWSDTNNTHASVTISMLNMLASYSWEDKPVLSLAAFAFNYAKFWHNHSIHSSSSLTFAKSTSLLKQLPSFIMDQLAAHTNIVVANPGLKGLNNLIKTIVDLTEVMVDFKELPSKYISQDVPPFACAVSHIPFTVYWTIRSIVAATETLRFPVLTSDTSEISTFIATIYSHMRLLLEFCLKHIEKRKIEEYYQKLVALVGTPHVDNYDLLRTLIYPKDDILPLYNCSTNTSVNIEVLRKKYVLLLVTDIDVSYKEFVVLKYINEKLKQHAARTNHGPYEIVWIPIVDKWDDGMQEKFEKLQKTMPWYSIYHPTIIDKAVIRFIKNVWQFRKNPIVVVLDPQGTLVSPNALHMMFIWLQTAFPFTTLKEEALWREESWKLETVVSTIHDLIPKWIQDDKYIFIYGGDDFKWVLNFIITLRSVAEAASVPVKTFYAGKSTNVDQVLRVIRFIDMKKMGHSLLDSTMIWIFWTRLQSMLFSKLQVGQTDENDIVFQGIKKLLSYDKEHGWVLLARGSQIVALGSSSSALTTLLEFEQWKVDLEEKGFHGAYADYHNKMAQPCCRLDFTTATANVPDNLQCPECHHHMEKLTTFNCCHKHDGIGRVVNASSLGRVTRPRIVQFSVGPRIKFYGVRTAREPVH